MNDDMVIWQLISLLIWYATQQIQRLAWPHLHEATIHTSQGTIVFRVLAYLASGILPKPNPSTYFNRHGARSYEPFWPPPEAPVFNLMPTPKVEQGVSSGLTERLGRHQSRRLVSTTAGLAAEAHPQASASFRPSSDQEL
jgi:hypothetical protein